MAIAAAVFACLIPVAGAAPGSGQFLVTATYVAGIPPPTSGFCVSAPTKSTFGAVVTVVCDTRIVADLEAPRTALPSTALHGGAFRFTHIADNELPGSRLADGFDSYTGAGTVTSWRMVSLADRDYVEMQIGW
jgi:hypothetical protein